MVSYNISMPLSVWIFSVKHSDTCKMLKVYRFNVCARSATQNSQRGCRADRHSLSAHEPFQACFSFVRLTHIWRNRRASALIDTTASTGSVIAHTSLPLVTQTQRNVTECILHKNWQRTRFSSSKRRSFSSLCRRYSCRPPFSLLCAFETVEIVVVLRKKALKARPWSQLEHAHLRSAIEGSRF